MIAKGGIADQRLKRIKYDQPPFSTAYPELVHYWDEHPEYPKRNVFEGNLFYRVGNVLKGRSEWAEFYNNWVTNQDPGLVDSENPMKGFKEDAALYSHIQGFPAIPFEEIGCNLPEDASDCKP